MARSTRTLPLRPAMLVALTGCLINPGLRDERRGALDGCDEVADGTLWYLDGDGDGFGDEEVAVTDCSAPKGYVADPTDCRDDDPAVNPDADERCDGYDNNCDLLVDDRTSVDAHHWMPDRDLDGYGDPVAEVVTCGPAPEAGMIEVGGDCDDGDAALNPGVDEICDGIDNNCDGAVDESTAVDAGVWYLDGDGDGFGDPGEPRSGCTQPQGTVDDLQDCDDSDPLTFPGGVDSTLEDHDCDGLNADLGVANAEINGAAGNQLGVAMAAAGDVDGDGYADFVVGAPGSDPLVDSGVAWLVLGRPGMGNVAMASEGIDHSGEDLGDEAGLGVAGGGDIDGDGFDDVLVGSPTAVGDRGSAYIVWGSSSPVGGSLLGTVEFRGDQAGDRMGAGLALGDLTGDGYADALVGAPFAGGGLVWLVTGGPGRALDGFIADLGEPITGSAGSQTGAAVAIAGDVDGDGISDLLIGAPSDDAAGSNHGAVYAISGGAGLGAMALYAGSAAVLTGEASEDQAGAAVAGAGDVDGDGYDDAIVGAPGYGAEGGAYLIRGGSGGLAGGSLAGADTTFVGPYSGSQFGHSVAGGSDVDGDGFDEVLIGAPEGDGQAYLQLGAASLPGWLDAAQCDVEIRGELSSDSAGTSVILAGDVDGDGYGDLVIGAAGHDHNATIDSGAVYLLYGTAL